MLRAETVHDLEEDARQWGLGLSICSWEDRELRPRWGAIWIARRRHVCSVPAWLGHCEHEWPGTDYTKLQASARAPSRRKGAHQLDRDNLCRRIGVLCGNTLFSDQDARGAHRIDAILIRAPI